jgi:uncharacterized protein (DUF433 family)
MNYQDVITIEPGKRGGRPTIRGMRIAVADVLGWLAAGMTHEEIISDYPELTEEDIRACLAYAADVNDDSSLLQHEAIVRSELELQTLPTLSRSISKLSSGPAVRDGRS